MTQQPNQTFVKLLELKHRIEFLRNSVDPDILIGAIERELCEFTEFQCIFNKFNKGWEYYIRSNIPHSEFYVTKRYRLTKLDSLYTAITDLTRN